MTRLLPALPLVLLSCGSRLLPQSTDSADADGPFAGEAEDTSLDCPRDQCDGACVDLRTDPNNCGGCGRTCVVPNAGAACEDSFCVLDICEEGWGDCDGALANGCEQASTCVTGGACTTSCGSTGSAVCTDICAPTCVTPVESCNAIDDNCDGACDEGALAGCRRNIYRSYGALGHVYGTDSGEAAGLGQSVENGDYFFVYSEETAGLAPLYRCDKGGGRRFLTLSASCELGVAPELVLGWVATSERCGAVPLYRLFSSAASNHFYTTSAAERDSVVAAHGYVSEGVAAWVWAGR